MIPKLTTVLFSSAIVFYIVLGRSFTWLDPPLTDTQLFAYIGNRWLHGDLPYATVWDQKPPGIFALNAAVFALFPRSFGALAATEMLVFLATSITVYFLLRQWQVDKIGRYLGVFVFALTANLNYSHSNIAEIYLLLTAALSMLCFSKAFPALKGKWLLLSGLAVGVGISFKPTGLVPLLAQSLFLGLLWSVSQRVSLLCLVASLSTVFAGVILAWLPFIFYFAYHGVLRDLINAAFIYPFNYASTQPRSIYTDLHRLVHFLADFYPLFIFILIGFFTCVVSLKTLRQSRCQDWLTRNPLTFYLLCACWVLFDIIAALAGNRSHSHYFLPLTLSISVLVGLTFTLQRETMDEKGFSKFAQLNILALLIAPLIFAHFRKEVREFYHLIKYGHTLSHDLKIGHDKPSLTERAREIAAFVGKIRSAHDTLFSWSYEPWIFWALDIKSPIKVLDLGFRRLFSGSLQHQFGEGVLSELKSHPPTLIIDTTKNPQLLRQQDRLYSDFSQYVEDQFECVRQFADGVRVFKRKQTDDTLSSGVSGVH